MMLRSSGKGVRIAGHGGTYDICFQHGGSDVCVYGRRETNIVRSGHLAVAESPSMICYTHTTSHTFDI